MIITAKYLVTYKYRNGIASADFFDYEEALAFCRTHLGARLYQRNEIGEWEKIL